MIFFSIEIPSKSRFLKKIVPYNVNGMGKENTQKATRNGILRSVIMLNVLIDSVHLERTKAKEKKNP